MAQTCARKRQELDEVHEAQRKDLEMSISKIPRPRGRYSQYMLDLMSSENHLASTKR